MGELFAEVIMIIDKEMEDLLLDHFDLGSAFNECSREERPNGKTKMTITLPNGTHTEFLFYSISRMIMQQSVNNKKPPLI